MLYRCRPLWTLPRARGRKDTDVPGMPCISHAYSATRLRALRGGGTRDALPELHRFQYPRVRLLELLRAALLQFADGRLAQLARRRAELLVAADHVQRTAQPRLRQRMYGDAL